MLAFFKTGDNAHKRAPSH